MRIVLLAVVAIAGVMCADTQERTGVTPAAAGTGDPVLLAAGDISDCNNDGDTKTEAILDAWPDATIATLGDNAYENGSTSDFNNCYHPTWGQHIARTFPSVGNHEYQTPNATGYYGYFGAAAGDPTKGYYSWDLGDWHMIALNSQCNAIAGGCGAGSPQELWLRLDLAQNAAQCTLAYWHHPRFNSGSSHGNNTAMDAFWRALYDYGADVVLNGHEHVYERFAPQTPDAVADATNGIREFIVGTGGRGHYTFGAPKPNSEVRSTGTLGVLKMTLHASSYDWEFLPEATKPTPDTGGSGSCHGPTQSDADADGWIDSTDNCPADANNLQENADRNFIDTSPPRPVGQEDQTRAHSDTLGDACDLDDDNDGLVDTGEPAGCNSSGALNPLNSDTDGDRVVDNAECLLGSDPGNPASRPMLVVPPDADSDGVPDAHDPDDGAIDSDLDGLNDRFEFRGYNTNLAATNTDGDTCGDRREAANVDPNTTVNSQDIGIVASLFGNPGGHANMDIDKNGAINSADIGLTAAAFGACP